MASRFRDQFGRWGRDAGLVPATVPGGTTTNYEKRFRSDRHPNSKRPQRQPTGAPSFRAFREASGRASHNQEPVAEIYQRTRHNQMLTFGRAPAELPERSCSVQLGFASAAPEDILTGSSKVTRWAWNLCRAVTVISRLPHICPSRERADCNGGRISATAYVSVISVVTCVNPKGEAGTGLAAPRSLSP
jgi:hypothetical protein